MFCKQHPLHRDLRCQCTCNNDGVPLYNPPDSFLPKPLEMMYQKGLKDALSVVIEAADNSRRECEFDGKQYLSRDVDADLFIQSLKERL